MQYTFLMCVHKNHDFLMPAIESVLMQSDEDFEFIIVANNCTDDLWVTLQKIDDGRLRIYRTTIAQLAFNLNYGLNECNDGYILRMDADDLCFPDRLKNTKSELQKFNYPDVLSFSVECIDEYGSKIVSKQKVPTAKKLFRSLWFKSTITHPSIAIKKTCLLGMGGYSGGFFSEDYDLWLRLDRSKAFRCLHSNINVLLYRIHTDQAKGNSIGYSEVAGYMLREFLLQKKVKYLAGAIIYSIKKIIRSKR